MVTALQQIQQRERDAAERDTAAGVARWAKRRRWSRTDTARWLNERSEAALAWLRRRPGDWPAHTRQLGYWLQKFAPRVLERAHTRLAAGTDESRENLLPGDVLK